MVFVHAPQRTVPDLPVVLPVVDSLEDRLLGLENRGRVGEVDPVLGKVLLPLPLIPFETEHEAL